MNSGPLSERICAGMPLVMKRSHRAEMTSVALSFRATLIARHSLVNSSMMHNIRYAFPSWVRSATKSYDQTCFGYSGRRRMQDQARDKSETPTAIADRTGKRQ